MDSRTSDSTVDRLDEKYSSHPGSRSLSFFPFSLKNHFTILYSALHLTGVTRCAIIGGTGMPGSRTAWLAQITQIANAANPLLPLNFPVFR